MNVLLDWDFVERRPEGKGERVKVDLVGRWLIRTFPLRNVIWELEAEDPKAVELSGQAATARAARDVDAAIALYRSALAVNPNHFGALFELAALYLEEENFAEAVPLYDRAKLVDADRARDGYIESVQGRGRDRLLLGQFDLARQDFAAALEVDPSNARAKRRLLEADEGIRRSAAARNPFTPAMPAAPDQLVGRERETAQILSSIRGGSHIAIYAALGMGKSSLLRSIASPSVLRRHGIPPDDLLPVVVDCSSLEFLDEDSLWRSLFDGLQRTLHSGDASVPSLDWVLKAGKLGRGSGWPAMADVLGPMPESSRTLVALLDDFGAMLVPHDGHTEQDIVRMQARLRGVGVQRGAAIVLSSSRPLTDLGPPIQLAYSPWFNIFSLLTLRPLGSREIEELASRFPESMTPSKSERAWLDVVAGGYPSVLQMALALLFEMHAADVTFDLNVATRELLARAEPLFSGLWQTASPTERVLFVLIALRNLAGRAPDLDDLSVGSEIERVFSQFRPELRRLQDLGLVILDEDAPPRLTASVQELYVLRELMSSNMQQLVRVDMARFVSEETISRAFDPSRWDRIATIVLNRGGVWGTALSGA